MSAQLNGAPVGVDDLQALALTNFGHFTSMRVDDGAVRGLSLHLDRLVRDCKAVFDADLDRARVLTLVRQATAGTQGSFVARVTVFDPNLEMGHPGIAATPHILVTSRPAGEMPPPPLRVQSHVFARDLAQVKHVGLFSQLQLRRQAQISGFDDALFVDERSVVSEGGTWNAAFVDETGAVVWPEADVLPGVTMQLLQQYKNTTTAPVTIDGLGGFRAAFATNTSIGVRAIAAIDDHEFDVTHPVLDALRQLYTRIPGEPL
jgi:branched-subunit amino acid aminotransferase/4-amino-4-deoxychorismate lyase